MSADQNAQMQAGPHKNQASNMNDFIVIIPARYNSTRLPGKPLLDIGGKPLLQWVYESACRSKAREVIIATDDERIYNVAMGFKPCR